MSSSEKLTLSLQEHLRFFGYSLLTTCGCQLVQAFEKSPQHQSYMSSSEWLALLLQNALVHVGYILTTHRKVSGGRVDIGPQSHHLFGYYVRELLAIQHQWTTQDLLGQSDLWVTACTNLSSSLLFDVFCSPNSKMQQQGLESPCWLSCMWSVVSNQHRLTCSCNGSVARSLVSSICFVQNISKTNLLCTKHIFWSVLGLTNTNLVLYKGCLSSTCFVQQILFSKLFVQNQFHVRQMKDLPDKMFCTK